MEKTTDRFGFLDDLQARVMALLQQTPAADMQKNLKALLTQQFARMDLVTRDEFDTQAQVLARTREKLERLERRLAQLEGASTAPDRNTA
ncbi:MAG: accessory factor UbiK family protein [Burkholderiaceae bacterium]|jgi:ubiquinone biosynthesis accessory factor UbiK|nr:accessory factor UbiK family protein [Burkholderiaceae bacterium]